MNRNILQCLIDLKKCNLTSGTNICAYINFEMRWVFRNMSWRNHDHHALESKLKQNSSSRVSISFLRSFIRSTTIMFLFSHRKGVTIFILHMRWVSGASLLVNNTEKTETSLCTSKLSIWIIPEYELCKSESWKTRRSGIFDEQTVIRVSDRQSIFIDKYRELHHKKP